MLGKEVSCDYACSVERSGSIGVSRIFMPRSFAVPAEFGKLEVSWTFASSIDGIVKLFAFLCTKMTFELRCIKFIITFLVNLIRDS